MRWDDGDTSPAASAAQFAAWERMGMEGRWRVVCRLSEDVRRVAADGIRARHPSYDEAAVRWALFRLIHGDALFAKAWPDAPRLDP